MKKLLLLFSMSLLVPALVVGSCTKKEDSPATTARVTYDANGGKFTSHGSVPTIDTIVKIGDYVPYPSDPTRPNYVFKGWCEDRECKILWSWLTKVEKDITLYARWEDDGGGGGGGGGKKTLKVEAWVSDTAATSAVIWGSVEIASGANIQDFGVCWVMPDGVSRVYSCYSEAGTAEAFSHTVTGLEPNTQYGYYAYAVDAKGNNVKSTEQTFTTTEMQDVPENLYLIGSPSEWGPTKALKFSHSEKSVFEDPVFSIVFSKEDGDIWFAFADDKAIDSGGDTFWSLIFGTTSGNGNNGKNGSYERRQNLTDDGSFLIPGEWGWNKVRFTINVLAKTYTLSEVIYPDCLYESGNSVGWGVWSPLAKMDENGNFEGFGYLDGGFKFTDSENWAGKIWGDAGEISTTPWVHSISLSGGDFTSPNASVFKMGVDLENNKATLTKVEYISMIGAYNGWNTDDDFSYDMEEGCWKGRVALPGGSEFKVRMNHDWDVNWGGEFDNMIQGGGNLSLPDGTYDFKFFLNCEGKNRLEYTSVE